MIEKYIEKEIMRQVKLTEYVYECKKLSVGELAQRLEVSLNTIKRDFQSLNLLLKNYIIKSEMSKTYLSIYFIPQYTRYDLIKELYKYSKFLNVCLSYLLGENSYLDIVENEFVSVTKAFQLKKKVEKYFMEIGIYDKNKNWVEDEYTFRLVMITILVRKSLDTKWIDQEKLKLAKKIVEQIFMGLSNKYACNKREYLFLVVSIYVTIIRYKQNPLNSLREEYDIKKSLAFREIKNKVDLFLDKYSLNDNEIIFLTFIYKSMPLNAHNYMIVNLNFQYERKYVIENNDNIKSLIHQFESEFQNKLSHQILFERSLIMFCYSMWSNLQNFIPYRHYYLSNKQLQIKRRVEDVLDKWKKNNLRDYPFSFNNLALQCFTSQVSESLTLKNNSVTSFFIVAESEESHILYHETLMRYINLEYNAIDPSLYYSLETLPNYINKNPHIIICERSVLLPTKKNIPNLFPISRNSIQEDLKVILAEILNIVG